MSIVDWFSHFKMFYMCGKPEWLSLFLSGYLDWSIRWYHVKHNQLGQLRSNHGNHSQAIKFAKLFQTMVTTVKRSNFLNYFKPW